MKKAISLLIAIVMLFSVIQITIAAQPGATDEPVDEQPISFDISQLFVDGRTITAEEVSRIIKLVGLFYRTDADGRKELMMSHRMIMIVALDDSEDINTIMGNPEAKKAFITRLGYNSEYVDIYYDGVYKDYLAENEYDFWYALTPKACELLKTDEMSFIERIYLGALILYGQSWMAIPIMGAEGAEDYTETEEFKYDVNLDGSFNVKDVLTFKKYISDSTIMVNIDACDANGDGRVNVRDLIYLKKALVNR